MGFAAGVILGALGSEKVPFAPLWALITSGCIFSGTVSIPLPEFIARAEKVYVIALMMVAINFRYAFYGFSLLNRWREAKFWRKMFLIFCLTDETYALEVASPIKDSKHYLRYCTTLAMLNLSYWIAGVVSGAIFVCALGKLFSIEAIKHWTNGIGFSMTALLLVILADQVRGWFSHD